MAALNKNTGEVLWKSAVPGGDVADYASIMAVDGKLRQYVQFMCKGAVGVDAKTGRFLWRYDRTAEMGANIMTPVVQGDRVFTSGSRSGGGLVELKVDGETVKASEVYFDKAAQAGTSRSGCRLSARGASAMGGTLSRVCTGTAFQPNAMAIWSDQNDPQPDGRLLIAVPGLGQTRDEDDLSLAPELMAEIASGTEAIDLHAEKREYEKAGVKEYLIVAPGV